MLSRRMAVSHADRFILTFHVAQWDRGTHMGAQEWARACRRVRNHPKLLDVR